jgi:AraC family transcriptional regulator of adaptative response/methylated-DNA-[protein]-cysteine methyltransferase
MEYSSMTDMHEEYWAAVQRRDHAYDGRFYTAVRTTGIYCKPSCPARHPARRHVRFYASPEAAEADGYRACRRCHPRQAGHIEPQLDRVVAICRYLEATDHIPTLGELSERFALSPHHLQRTFRRIVGVSPRQYADAFRQGRLKAFLKQQESVTDALYAAGYGSSSRLYEQSDDSIGMTPIHYRSGGEHVRIAYTTTRCRLGALLVAATERGVCTISLGEDEAMLEQHLRHEFPHAALHRDTAGLHAWVQAIVAYLDGQQRTLDLPLDIQATGFQRRVWEALRAIPYGETRSYQQIAAHIGQPSAVRAVAQACAANPTALAIPCHRVVRSDGSLSGYRWGVPRKRALLHAEQTHTDRAAERS